MSFEKMKTFIEGGRITREDLASRETVNIGGQELNKGDHVYPLGKHVNEDVVHEIMGWDDTGVIMKPVEADKLGRKDRLLGKGDEFKISWDDLDRFAPHLPESEEK